MNIKRIDPQQKVRVVVAAVLVWFFMFPEDLEMIVTPVIELTQFPTLGFYIALSTTCFCLTWARLSKTQNITSIEHDNRQN